MLEEAKDRKNDDDKSKLECVKSAKFDSSFWHKTNNADAMSFWDFASKKALDVSAAKRFFFDLSKDKKKGFFGTASDAKDDFFGTSADAKDEFFDTANAKKDELFDELAKAKKVGAKKDVVDMKPDFDFKKDVVWGDMSGGKTPVWGDVPWGAPQDGDDGQKDDGDDDP